MTKKRQNYGAALADRRRKHVGTVIRVLFENNYRLFRYSDTMAGNRCLKASRNENFFC
jgi:hypothetical protein